MKKNCGKFNHYTKEELSALINQKKSDIIKKHVLNCKSLGVSHLKLV